MKNYLDFTKTLNINDVAFDGKMLPQDIMGLFQQAVTAHTFEMELDFASILRKYNAKWFIVSAHLEIERAPAIDETVTVRTWPQKASALKFPRAFTMKDENGNIVASAMTQWCIVDHDTNEIMRAKTLEFPFDEFIEEDPTSTRGRIPVSDAGERCYSRKMLLSDIDLNRHVNNVSYIRIGMDCFSSAELENMQITALDIQYKLQCYEGDTLDLYRLETENGYIIEGKRGEDSIFKMMLTIKK
ncbi:MAG: hypothetical protein IJ408_06120 [Clostridia bacterium]|nr:hypothetical protein [Clostridia bacterium]